MGRLEVRSGVNIPREHGGVSASGLDCFCGPDPTTSAPVSDHRTVGARRHSSGRNRRRVSIVCSR